MQFDEMRRRQHAIASSRNRQSNTSSSGRGQGGNILTKKFSLLLPQITAPSPHYPRYEYEASISSRRGGGGGGGRGWVSTTWSLKCICALLAPSLLLLLLSSYYSGRYSQQQQQQRLVGVSTTATVRSNYWRANNVLLGSNTNNITSPPQGAGGLSNDDLIYNENDEAGEEQTIPPTNNDHTRSDIDNEEVVVVDILINEEQTSKNIDNNGSSSIVEVVVVQNKNTSSFKYIGNLNSTIPNPWPNTDVDWWDMHTKLVMRVQLSDNNTYYNVQEKDADEKDGEEEEEEEEDEHEQNIILPQLIFIGDSITEGWEGTSLGQIPQPSRGWGQNPTNEIHAIQTIFDTKFGIKSNYWGKYTWKLPLVLGIGGSRTDDLLWRLENGEFPTSVRRQHQQQQRHDDDDADVESDVQQVESNDDEDNQEKEVEEDDVIEVDNANNNRHRRMETPTKIMEEQTHDNNDTTTTYQVDQLERIYIVLIGTNNLGGGMTPHQTIRGIDAVGRMIYKLHLEKYYSAAFSSSSNSSSSSSHSSSSSSNSSSSNSSSSNSTNDLLNARIPPPPVAIVLSELLPRYDSQRAMKMCPPKCKNNITLEAYTTFMPAIDAVNRALPNVVDGWRKDFINSRIVLLSSSIHTEDEEDVGNGDYDNSSSSQKNKSNNDGAALNVVKDNYTHMIECGREMFIFDDESEFETYMPDRLHPNAKGYELWSHCLLKGLAAIVD